MAANLYIISLMSKSFVYTISLTQKNLPSVIYYKRFGNLKCDGKSVVICKILTMRVNEHVRITARIIS